MRNPRFALFTLFFCIFGTSILLVASQRSAPVDNDKIEDYYSYGEPDDIDDNDFDNLFFTDITFNYTTFIFLSTSQHTTSPLAMNILTQLMRDGHITDAVLPWNTGRPLVLRLNRTTTGQNAGRIIGVQVV
ncbi:Uncharacterized protein BM_BM41 [Brugia malayi]|uniref:Bm102; Bm104; Bm41 n=1 Tax=Brugia malayi TaxID=6279 RepID=A0A4E9F353_BRUMA|nr:Uncharacterized protein BM_BM41 [Brugia malayi]VIO90445.1 Uncharacterized protein BM_BM41 [Brugia malayi]